MSKFKIILIFVLLYIANILLCAYLYSISELQHSNPLGTFDYIYFSIVTITNLGYGEIIPNSTFAKSVVVFESLSGILLLGLVLNAIWQSYIENQNQEFEKSLLKQRKQQLLQSICSHEKILRPKIQSHLLNMYSMLTEIGERHHSCIEHDGGKSYSNQKNDSEQLSFLDNPVCFSRMQHIFSASQRSILAEGVCKMAILDFFQSENELKNSLELFLTLNNFEYHESLRSSCVEMLSAMTDDHLKNDIQALVVKNRRAGKFIERTIADIRSTTFKGNPKIINLHESINKSRIAFVCFVKELNNLPTT